MVDNIKLGDVIYYDTKEKSLEIVEETGFEEDYVKYYDLKRYLPIGVVIDVSLSTNCLKVLSPYVLACCINNFKFATNSKAIKAFKNIAKKRSDELKKDFSSNSSKIKLYIPEAEEVDIIIKNADLILEKVNLIHLLSSKLFDYNVSEIISSEILSYIDDKKLMFMLGGLNLEIQTKKEKIIAAEYLSYKNGGWNLEQYSVNNDLDAFVNASDKTSEVILTDELPHKDVQPEIDDDRVTIHQSIEDIVEEHPNLELLDFYIPLCVILKID